MVKNKRKKNQTDSLGKNGLVKEGEDPVQSDGNDEENDGFSEEEVNAQTSRHQFKKMGVKRNANGTELSLNDPAATKTKSPTNKSNANVKPPTLQEINELKETRNLFHSNLFRLQVKEMLSELKVKDKYKNYVQSWLEKFTCFVKSLESMPVKEDMNKMKWLEKSPLKNPLLLQQLQVKQQKISQFQFLKPTTDPYLIGAAATSTLLGPKLIVDICVTMPAECFQKENYLNLVYDQKRAYYLTFIGTKMLTSEHFDNLQLKDLKYNYYANNPLKSVLEIIPSTAGKNSNIGNKLILRIFAAAEEKTFKLNRFIPWNNNVRATIFSENVDKEEETLPLATPNYNANVLFDLTMEQNQRLLREVFESSKNYQEGLVLLKVWLQQRQLNVGFSGFQAHTMAMFMAYLSGQRKLHTNMSSYQVARTVWNHLALSTWDEDGKGISLCRGNKTTVSNQPTLEQFHSYYDVVFIDATGFYNITANLSKEIYRRVCVESKIAVDMLNDIKLNSFHLLFMTKYPLYSQFDHILKINKDDVVEQILELHVSPSDKHNYFGYAYPQLLKVVTRLLYKGLGKRVDALLPIEQPLASWAVNDEPPICPTHLNLGIILNAEHALEVLDKGPESIADNAEEFRSFWGDKAQLRRFQDGTITESVVWASASDILSKKRLIVRSIVLQLLQHHFQIDSKDIEYVAGEFDVVYKLTPAFKTDKLYEKYKVAQDTDAEAASLPVIRCFDDLARKLHASTDLPLEIVSIAGISPVFRYCQPEPIMPQARCINERFYATHVQRGIIQLGLSGKWPDELGALRAIKTAFYIQIAQMLHEKYKLRCKITYDGILLLKQGYCFAIEIAHPKEIALTKKEKNERGITQYVDSEASIRLEKRYYILPKVTGALHALHQQQPSFGGTVMIAKRWLYSQLIDEGLWPDECTELLIATLYLKAVPTQQAINSPQTGFIRFLQMLARTDWKTEMFTINFNNLMEEDEISDVEQRFSAERDAFPPLTIITSYDQKHYGLVWTTQQQPNVNVLARVTILARETLTIIESSLLSSGSFIRTSKIFTASNQGYDLVIQLKPDVVPNTLAFEFGSPFAALGKPNWRLPLADTNFAKDAVAKLREAYSDFAAFFYNPCGGKEIGVIWKPLIFEEKDFKVNDVNGCSLINPKSKKIQCKKEVLIEDFKFILKDFYLRIDTVDAILTASQESVKLQNASTSHSKEPARYYEKILERMENGGKTKWMGGGINIKSVKKKSGVVKNKNKLAGKTKNALMVTKRKQ